MFQNRTAVDLKVGGPATAALGTSDQQSCLGAWVTEGLHPCGPATPHICTA